MSLGTIRLSDTMIMSKVIRSLECLPHGFYFNAKMNGREVSRC